MRAACWIARAPAWRSQDKSAQGTASPARRDGVLDIPHRNCRGRRPRRPVLRGSTYRPVGRGPCAPPPGTHFSAGHMGPALQVHTPPKKKQRGAPDGAPRVFRPCVAQTEEGYIRRFYKREPRGLILKNLSRLLLFRQWSAYRWYREQSGRKDYSGQQVQSCQSV